jgi:hypothetical protein
MVEALHQERDPGEASFDPDHRELGKPRFLRLRGSNWRKSLDHFQKTVNERLQVELGSLVCLNVMRGLVPRIHVFTHQGRGWPGQALGQARP